MRPWRIGVRKGPKQVDAHTCSLVVRDYRHCVDCWARARFVCGRAWLEHRVNTVRQNPWTIGDAFLSEFNFDLPPINSDPVGAALDLISDFLGIDLPGLGVKLGATVSGHAGLDFGYYVNGGFPDLSYLARGT